MVFILTASPAPAEELRVYVSVIQTGDFLTGDVPTSITIAGETSTAYLILQTEDDDVDEVYGHIIVKVLPGGYIRGSPFIAGVIVADNDPPDPLLIPTGLHANGNIVNGEVSIWWQPSIGATGATRYVLRYAIERCSRPSL